MPAQILKEKKRKGKDSDSDSDDGTDTEVRSLLSSPIISNPTNSLTLGQMLDVSFDFYDPQPHDYSSIVLLLTQLLSSDSTNLDLGGIAELVLEQKLVGSTVKTDGNEGDPYAVLTVLNLNVHKDNSSISQLLTYLLTKSSSHPSLHSTLTSLLSPSSSESTESSALSPTHLGLVLSERLVNMPVQVMPPMYKMLGEELQWARDDKEPYHFSHLLFLSRVFLSSQEDFEEDPNAALNAESGSGGKEKKDKKKNKKAKTTSGNGSAEKGEKGKEEIWMYHAEDEYISRSATHTHTYPFTSSRPKEEGEKGADSFGVETRGQMMLVPWEKFGGIVEGLEGFLGGLE